MKSALLTEWRAAFIAELRKILALKTHITILAITLSLLLVVLIGEFALSSYAAKQMKTKEAVNLGTMWKIFQICAQYLNPFVLATIVSSQVGKEFEWKTFHQIALKGQTPLVYVLSKLATFFTLALGAYILQFVIVAIFYTARALAEGQAVDIPFAQVVVNSAYAFLAIAIGFLMATLTTSASLGIVFTFLYLIVFEMIMFPLVGQLMGMLNQHGVATALSYAPMKLPSHIAMADNAGEVLLLVGAIVGLLFVFGYAAYFILNRRQIGLIR
ncbi:MAG: hypothetical protein JSR44_11810 [Spirochaetes bacterium]|nr:hypothetical protein [Spirochaetota bacterium]